MNIKMTLLSDVIAGNGESIPGAEDISVLRDPDGFPYYRGGTLKGVFREELTNYLAWSGDDAALETLSRLLGSHGDTEDGEGKLRFSNLTLPDFVKDSLLKEKDEKRISGPEEILDSFTYMRTFTAIDEDGTVKDGSLRNVRCLKEGLIFYGTVTCAKEDEELVRDVLSLIKWIGTMRSRGFGRVCIEQTAGTSGTAKNRPAAALNEIMEGGKDATYIRVAFRNTEPVRVADDSVSQSGQTDTLTYIPGSSLRGALIAELIRCGTAAQDEINPFVSDQVCFLNAYPVMGEKTELIPSLKGFYEDKGDAGDAAKKVKSVVTDGEVDAGHKRASLGTFGCPAMLEVPGEPEKKYGFRFMSVDKSGELKINLGKESETGKKEKKNVFRNQYICAGYSFAAYIRVTNEDLKETILRLLIRMRDNDSLLLGNARSSGFGKCTITDIRLQEALPYAPYAEDTDAAGCAYMALLSDMTMRNSLGENAGIDIEQLREQTGLADLEIQFCSTSVVGICGYNRHWHARVPGVKMYQKGSVFKLTFSGTLTAAKMRQIEDAGIGIRRNEGYGRVLFIKDYEQMQYKKKIRENLRGAGSAGSRKDPEAEAVMQIAVKGIMREQIERAVQAWLLDPPAWRGSVKGSQLGMIRAILSRYRYTPDRAIRELQNYLKHQQGKEKSKNIQKDTNDRKGLDKSISYILENDIYKTLCITNKKVCGYSGEQIFTKAELDTLKIDLLIRRIDRENREGKKNG